MRSLNKVFLLGRIGVAPEIQRTKNGSPYTSLSVATHRSLKEGDEFKEVTDWHSVMVWGDLAEICTNGISKGALVFVEGHLRPYKVPGTGEHPETRQSIHALRVSFFSTVPKGLPVETVAS